MVLTQHLTEVSVMTVFAFSLVRSDGRFSPSFTAPVEFTVSESHRPDEFGDYGRCSRCVLAADRAEAFFRTTGAEVGSMVAAHPAATRRGSFPMLGRVSTRDTGEVVVTF